MADEYSTPLDMLMQPTEPEKCQPYPAVTPQQTNGSCRGHEVMDRTYEVPSPSSFNFATDARPNPPGAIATEKPATLEEKTQQESFGMPDILMNLKNISLKEYLLMVVVIYCALRPETMKIVENNMPNALVSDDSSLSVTISVLFTLVFYVAREYFVYM
tara:strand:- start:3759 stop:4235 length:477 start_codon:yes stop_codon:yes gene_type:complete